jgi:hypothetical protein
VAAAFGRGFGTVVVDTMIFVNPGTVVANAEFRMWRQPVARPLAALRMAIDAKVHYKLLSGCSAAISAILLSPCFINGDTTRSWLDNYFCWSLSRGSYTCVNAAARTRMYADDNMH